MNCLCCQSEKTQQFGKDCKSNQRFICLDCGKICQPEREKPLGEMILALDKAENVQRHLTEGSSIRTTERLNRRLQRLQERGQSESDKKTYVSYTHWPVA